MTFILNQIVFTQAIIGRRDESRELKLDFITCFTGDADARAPIIHIYVINNHIVIPFHPLFHLS